MSFGVAIEHLVDGRQARNREGGFADVCCCCGAGAGQLIVTCQTSSISQRVASRCDSFASPRIGICKAGSAAIERQRLTRYTGRYGSPVGNGDQSAGVVRLVTGSQPSDRDGFWRDRQIAHSVATSCDGVVGIQERYRNIVIGCRVAKASHCSTVVHEVVVGAQLETAVATAKNAARCPIRTQRVIAAFVNECGADPYITQRIAQGDDRARANHPGFGVATRAVVCPTQFRINLAQCGILLDVADCTTVPPVGATAVEGR